MYIGLVGMQKHKNENLLTQEFKMAAQNMVLAEFTLYSSKIQIDIRATCVSSSVGVPDSRTSPAGF